MGMAATRLKDTATLSEADRTWYEDAFLEHVYEPMLLYNHGSAQLGTGKIPKNRGTTVNWFRYHPLARKTAGRSEGKTTYTAQAFKAMTVEAQVEIWDSVATVSELMWYAGRDGGMTGATQVLGEQAGESVEQETVKLMAEGGCWPLPRNAYNATTGIMVASFYAENIAATKTGTTTTFIGTGLNVMFEGNMSNDVLIGAFGCVSKGRGYGHAFRVTSYDSDGGAATVPSILFTPAAPEALTSEVGCISYITLGLPNHNERQLDANDTMTTGFLLKAKTILQKNKAKRFADGTYHAMIDPDVKTQLMALDTTWINQMTQSRPEKGEKGYIGTWMGISFFETNIVARYPIVSNTANAISFTAGAMRTTFIMGRDSFGKVSIGNELNDPQLIFKGLDSGGVANPTESYATMAWKIIWKIKPLNANWCVAAFTYMA